MSVNSVDSSPPAKSPEAVRHERQVAERREENKVRDEARHVERQERAEPRGRSVDVKA